MLFTSYEYVLFLGLVLALYWGIRNRTAQNLLILVASYVFYGWVHPWFCILIGVSTVVDYLAGLGMQRNPEHKHPWLLLSLFANLGMLGVFKYFNFFADNVTALAGQFGWQLDPITTRIFLPVGISFYTFQTLSYTIDLYYGKLEARKNFIDFAVFVSFFPQLVAGPIERARRFLPQIEKARVWDSERFFQAFPLLIVGFLKKLVVADNVAVVVNKVFMLENPSFGLLTVGTLAFAFQIYADFSAYTDIARGSARLIGFELIKNFDHPYSAISPSDFWRRWHISFSTWIRDYLYIPMGGSRVKTQLGVLMVLLASMGLSGLWHGAAWNFVAWGIYHALLLFIWRRLGLSGRWTPSTRLTHTVAWSAMFCFTLIGWAIFRAPSLGWLVGTFEGMSLLGSEDELLATLYSLCTVGLFSLLMLIPWPLRRQSSWPHPLPAISLGLAIVAIVVFAREDGLDFIYFQF